MVYQLKVMLKGKLRIGLIGMTDDAGLFSNVSAIGLLWCLDMLVGRTMALFALDVK